MACDFLARCSFYCRFRERRSNVWKGMVGFYCKGDGYGVCEGRKKFLKEETFPGDQFLPTGNPISKAFFDLP